jgi:hypothetical protein
MKIKPLYIYAIIIVIAVIFLIIFTGSPENQSAKMNGRMKSIKDYHIPDLVHLQRQM